ncbi:MAG: hypothetical protein OZ921_02740 [Sorangiineae bacterium]|nr:hypothetical protein [Polyangiaceae bacterium]MEB2321404.1 hypothetical protein [Sorangiineae bacterium]
MRRSLRDERERGLPSLNQARAERRRAIVAGKVKVPGMSLQFWLWAAVLLAGFGLVYFKIQQGKLESQKAMVMAKQRAIAQSLGPRILPFRDRIEGFVKELAGPWQSSRLAAGAELEKVRSAGGVYLRIRLANAETPKAIRKAASRSLHDGFTACFFARERAPDPTVGPKCQSLSDCGPGLLCNEYGICAPPPEPFNLRLAYRALRVLSTEWTDELHQATSDLAVGAYERDLERVTREDVPIAIELLTRARYFTAVLDEEPAKGTATPDGGAADETDEERLQRVAHPARVGIWDLRSGAQILRLRAVAGATVMPVGERVVRAPDIVAAQQRQVNSCALALEVRGAAERAREEPADGGAGDGAAVTDGAAR